MAVIIEAFSVIVRRDAIRRAFGDERALAALARNTTGCADEHLYRIGFFASEDVDWYIQNVLNPNGLVYTHGEEAVDLTVADQTYGLHAYTPWLEVGTLQVPEGEVLAAWLAGTEPGELKTHSNWNYEGYSGLKRQDGDVSSGEQRSAKYPALLEKFDPETGRMIYTARIYGQQPATTEPTEEQFRRLQEVLNTFMQRAMRVHDHKWRGQPAHEQAEIDALETQLERDLALLQRLNRGGGARIAMAHLAEGHILMALDRHAEAEPPLRKAYALAPNWAEVPGELMASLSSQGKTQDAIEVGRRAHALHPHHPVIAINLAIALHATGSNDEAIAALDRLLQAHPGHEAAVDVRQRILASKPRGGLLARLLGRRHA